MKPKKMHICEMITENKISEIIKKIASGYNPEKIILFGSHASGKASENSDIDIFVIKNSELPRPQRTMQLRRMLFGSQIPMDLIVYTPNEVESEKDEEYGFVYEVLNSGKTVYERKND
jgi:uncharacterized protein